MLFHFNHPVLMKVEDLSTIHSIELQYMQSNKNNTVYFCSGRTAVLATTLMWSQAVGYCKFRISFILICYKHFLMLQLIN